MPAAKTVLVLVLTVFGGVLWLIPLVVGIRLVIYQYQQGTGSLFLIALGVLPYAVPLAIIVLGPALLLRNGRVDSALGLAGVLLGLGIPIVFLWFVGLGST